jgi:Zn-finger nucleic acid-binding protein
MFAADACPVGLSCSVPTALPCPRCQQVLEQIELRGVAVRLCRRCTGSLVEQRDLDRLLEAMSVNLIKTFDPGMRLRPLTDEGGSLRCPRCRETMTNDDYCGAGLVHFDRCERCSLLWLDAGELGTMTLMWAGMETRLDRVEAQNRAELRQVDNFVDHVLLARVVSDALFSAVH